ncbi:hypothetical protein WJX82_009659 [Trebouxia sp. C0006]
MKGESSRFDSGTAPEALDVSGRPELFYLACNATAVLAVIHGTGATLYLRATEYAYLQDRCSPALQGGHSFIAVAGLQQLHISSKGCVLVWQSNA